MPKVCIFVRSILSCVVGLSIASTAVAGTSAACSSEMVSRSDSFISHSQVSWEQLSQHWSTNKACDDGHFAEGYSEKVVHLLAYRWETFSEFANIARTRPEFYSWVIRHIDESTSPDDLTKVRSNAMFCHTNEKFVRFCKDVAHAAEQALKQTGWK